MCCSGEPRTDSGGTSTRSAGQQWHDPTPCTDWDVRTLVNHVTVEQLWVPPLVGRVDRGRRRAIASTAISSGPTQWRRGMRRCCASTRRLHRARRARRHGDALGGRAADGRVLLGDDHGRADPFLGPRAWASEPTRRSMPSSSSWCTSERCRPPSTSRRRDCSRRPCQSPTTRPCRRSCSRSSVAARSLSRPSRRKGTAVAKPTILTVDDDPAVSQAITRDLRQQYGADYQIVRAHRRAPRRSTVLAEFALRDRPVALIASDQRMPEMTGVEFLEQARRHAPDAKLVLLTAYADTDVAIRAINDIGLDYYLLKPWDPPEERLYPVLDDLLERLARADTPTRPAACGSSGTAGPSGATRSRRSSRATTCRTAGSTSSATTRPHRLQAIAAGEHGRPAARARSRRRDAARAVDARPRRARSACARSAEQPLYDLCIVGGGPGRARRRGLRRLRGAADRRRRTRGARRPGRAERGDRELPRLPEGPVRRRPHPPRRRPGPALRRGDGARARRRGLRGRAGRCAPCASATAREIEARAVLVATGVSYRLLDAPGLDELTGRGVYYGATASEARVVRGRRRLRRRRGQLGRAGRAEPRPLRAARRDARAGRRAGEVDVAVPRRAHPRRRRTSRCGCRPRWSPGAATATSRRSRSPTAAPGPRSEVPTNWLFVFIGASPRTDWLGDDVARDDKGFVITGPDLLARRDGPALAARPSAVRARDQRARRVRGRRRAARLDEAGRVGRRRGRDVGLPRPPLPGDDLMDVDDLRGLFLFDGLERRPAGRAARGRRARSASTPATCCSRRASPPTSGGCCSRGGSTWCAGPAARSPSST